ncbi:hypothetical protein GOP47_0009704 [Adiantum capillus-veneris]|uniref:Ubiquitin-like protease family profile domain-containing protein n=1 Tax=Adiantum capillus-veneris TaxID=13818 RepID=A0A9D4UX27_ADICA|nr:hypothetical protein GOP47_0009704 [Adiantum capillus-veneris]
MNSPLLITCLRLMMHTYELDLQQKVEYLDPSISHFLRTETNIRELTKWLIHVDLEICEIFLIPYHESSHWSLIAIDIVKIKFYFVNSLAGVHGQAKLFIETLENCPPMPKMLTEIQFSIVKVPIQPESHSCGWRVVTNAKLLLDFIYCNDNQNIEINRECYSKSSLVVAPSSPVLLGGT